MQVKSSARIITNSKETEQRNLNLHNKMKRQRKGKLDLQK